MSKVKAEFMINGIVNSQRMLCTKQYQLSKNRLFVEDKWLVSYLYQSGVQRDLAFRYWKEIYIGRWGDVFPEDELEYRFSEWWGKTIPFFEGHKIVIFWEEIVAINNAKLLPWERQFVLLLLGYFKFMGWVSQKLDYIPLGKLMKWTSCGRRREAEDMKMFADPEDAGVLQINKNTAMVSFPILKSKGHVACVLRTSMDLPQLLGFLRNEKQCPVCGAVFAVTGCSKTDLCHTCWKEQRRAMRAGKCQNKETNQLVIESDLAHCAQENVKNLL